jgi:hypothetical protein
MRDILLTLRYYLRTILPTNPDIMSETTYWEGYLDGMTNERRRITIALEEERDRLANNVRPNTTEEALLASTDAELVQLLISKVNNL